MPSESSKFAPLFEASRAGLPWRRDSETAPTVIPRPPLVTVEESSVPPGVPFNIQYDERGHMRIFSLKHYPAVDLTIGDCIDA